MIVFNVIEGMLGAHPAPRDDRDPAQFPAPFQEPVASNVEDQAPSCQVAKLRFTDDDGTWAWAMFVTLIALLAIVLTGLS